jgi:PPP family 3-phenylpropionic acid transporter
VVPPRPFLAFAGFYGAVFLALGIYMPFWPLWLGHRGLDAASIGLVLALAAWIRVAVLPLLGFLSDRLGRPKAALVGLALGAVALFLAFPAASGLAALAAVQVAFALAFHALVPLGESRAMAAATEGRLDYGRTRLWGSLTYIAGSLGAGLLVSGRSPDLVYWLVLAALVATLGASAVLPAPARRAGQAGSRVRAGDVARLLRDRGFLLFLAAAGLLQGSHAVYYGFSALHWRAAGYSEAAVGWLWAVGVGAEVLLFLRSAPLVARLGPGGLLALAAGGGILRWVTLALTSDPAILTAAQSLHALTFGAAHLGAMHVVARSAPPGLAASAQALYAAISGGLIMGAAMILAGRLYQAQGAGAFLAMAAMSLCGLVLVGLSMQLRRDA